MILTDFSQISIAAIMANFYATGDAQINQEYVRQVILGSIKKIDNQFKAEYGRQILCCDGKNYWRKDLFPYYKIKRAQQKEEHAIDWDEVHRFIDKVRDEIKTYLNWPVVVLDKTEGDDIIGTLTLKAAGKVLIVSRDGDFKQLLGNPNVKQFDPIHTETNEGGQLVKGKFIEVADANRFLFEKICKGDTSDSIPNVVSPNNSIATGERQKSMFQKKIDEWFTEGPPVDTAILERMNLNEKLIDFRKIPTDISKLILKEAKKEYQKPHRNSMQILAYLQETHAGNWASSLQDFL